MVIFRFITRSAFGGGFSTIQCSLIQSFQYGILAPEFTHIFETRDKHLQMKMDEKRKQYTCETFFNIESIETWASMLNRDRTRLQNQLDELTKEKHIDVGSYSGKDSINTKVSLWRGDITSLEIDSIVNAANNSLLGGGGVDGAIHRAAGPGLLEECKMLNGCKTGEAKLTGGYKLPAKYVIHTVGPRGENPLLLHSCYNKCLGILRDQGFKSTAFPCISTGVYGYPQLPAAMIALKTVREFLDRNSDKVERIIFCLYLPTDVSIYESLMQLFFPPEQNPL